MDPYDSPLRSLRVVSMTQSPTPNQGVMHRFPLFFCYGSVGQEFTDPLRAFRAEGRLKTTRRFRV